MKKGQGTYGIGFIGYNSKTVYWKDKKWSVYINIRVYVHVIYTIHTNGNKMLNSSIERVNGRKTQNGSFGNLIRSSWP